MSRVPLRATYRLQFNAGFTFADASAQIDYLATLGISHLYCSPVFASRPGSGHGYDAVDPRRIDAELGGEEAFRAFAARAREAGLGLILDIVPNHMAAHASNAAWLDVLAFGEAALSAPLFDIDWSRRHILVPVLGANLEEVIGRGEIVLERHEKGGLLVARYYDHVLPLRPSTAARLLDEAGLATAAAAWRAADTDTLDAPTAVSARSALRILSDEEAAALGRVLAAADLPAVLAEQHWRLTHWRSARKTLSHRRFFNINDLIGVRVEDPAVFSHTHALVLKLVAEGLVDGLRIDHIDGLADPEGYCRRLRGAVGPDVPIFVEKILEGEERLRPWPVEGTTGYERLCDINGLFVDGAGRDALFARLRQTGLVEGGPEERLAAAKRQVLAESFGSELDQLCDLAAPLLGEDGPDRRLLRETLTAMVVHCPVYRSYATQRGFCEEDEAVWSTILTRIAAAEPEALLAPARALLEAVADGHQVSNGLRVRFQQLTGPAMAKGLEDTELYRTVGLISLNEVGSDAERRPVDGAAFHRRVAASGALVPLATHDTKLGADTRGRLDTLSLVAPEWIALVERWSEAHAGLRAALDTGPAPDALDEWRLYQVLFGAWPIDEARLREHILKMLREAKRHTRWESPNRAYEEGVMGFAAALLAHPDAAAFRAELAAFIEARTLDARINAIAQTILQATIPGTPDYYQGTELWDFSLVDPDNRRPIDWAARRAALIADRPVLAADEAGAAKLRAIRALLDLRMLHPDAFRPGTYRPLGAPAGWIAFERRGSDSAIAVAVPLRGQASGARPAIEGLVPGRYRNAIDGNAGLEVSSIAGKQISLDPDWPFLVAVRL